MDLKEKFKKEFGVDAYENNDFRPTVPSNYYVEWLEEQLASCNVVGQSEHLVCDCGSKRKKNVQIRKRI